MKSWLSQIAQLEREKQEVSYQLNEVISVLKLTFFKTVFIIVTCFATSSNWLFIRYSLHYSHFSVLFSMLSPVDTILNLLFNVLVNIVDAMKSHLRQKQLRQINFTRNIFAFLDDCNLPALCRLRQVLKCGSCRMFRIFLSLSQDSEVSDVLCWILLLSQDSLDLFDISDWLAVLSYCFES